MFQKPCLVNLISKVLCLLLDIRGNSTYFFSIGVYSLLIICGVLWYVLALLCSTLKELVAWLSLFSGGYVAVYFYQLYDFDLI